MGITLLYSSLDRTRERHAMAEQATREGIGVRGGDWKVCLIAPPRQPLWVVIIDGPNDFTGKWVFDQDDQRFDTVRQTIDAALRRAGL